MYLLSIYYLLFMSCLEGNSLKVYFIDFSFRILLQKSNIKNLGSAKDVNSFSFLRALHPPPCSPAVFLGTKKAPNRKDLTT